MPFTRFINIEIKIYLKLLNKCKCSKYVLSIKHVLEVFKNCIKTDTYINYKKIFEVKYFLISQGQKGIISHTVFAYVKTMPEKKKYLKFLDAIT